MDSDSDSSYEARTPENEATLVKKLRLARNLKRVCERDMGRLTEKILQLGQEISDAGFALEEIDALISSGNPELYLMKKVGDALVKADPKLERKHLEESLEKLKEDMEYEQNNYNAAEKQKRWLGKSVFRLKKMLASPDGDEYEELECLFTRYFEMTCLFESRSKKKYMSEECPMVV